MSARGAAALVLGVETSCDDTSVAVLEGGRTLRAHLIAAQDVHRLYGGVVPSWRRARISSCCRAW